MAQSQLIFQGKSDLIFDLDGTLVDSVPDLAGAVNDMLTQLSLDTFEVDTIRTWVGNGAKMLVERALSGSGQISANLDPNLAANALAIFLGSYEKQACVNTCLYDGVKDTLAELVSRGYTLHIVTNKPLVFVEPILTTLEIKSYFTQILGADSLAKKKPDPLPLLYVAKQQNITVESCVMIGDSHNDILAANACAMDSVGLTYGYNYGEDIGLHQPNVVFNHFNQLISVLPQRQEVTK